MQQFVYTQLNDQTVLFQIIRFSISHLFAYSLNIKHFYLTHWLDHIRWYHSGPEWTWEWRQWIGTLPSPKLHHYRSLTIRLFHVISGLLLGEGFLSLCRDAVGVFYGTSRLGHNYIEANRLIDQLGRVFANGPGDRGSILCRVIPKTLKIVLDTSLLNTQPY